MGGYYQEQQLISCGGNRVQYDYSVCIWKVIYRTTF